jgi:hypothetical protein
LEVEEEEEEEEGEGGLLGSKVARTNWRARVLRFLRRFPIAGQIISTHN